MKPVFVDTSALIALGNRKDIFHRQADEVRQELVRNKRTFLTTGLVIAELCNTFSTIKSRPIAIGLVESICESDKWICVNADENLMERGFALFKQMSDKEWGLVDCVSIIVAKQHKVTEIFTTDHHFEQSGFRILLNIA